MRRPSRLISLILVSVVAISMWFAYEVVRGLKGMATWQVGMSELHLPSGTTVYIRRQTNEGKPEDLYLSASGDYCAPYDRWHDYKLATFSHDQPQPLVWVSYSGDTILVHTSEKPKSPWLFPPKSFKVEFQPLTPSEYSAYAALPEGTSGLPAGWQRVKVDFGHNTCSL